MPEISAASLVDASIESNLDECKGFLANEGADKSVGVET